MTFVVSAIEVAYTGSTPVFVDSHLAGGNFRPSAPAGGRRHASGRFQRPRRHDDGEPLRPAGRLLSHVVRVPRPKNPVHPGRRRGTGCQRVVAFPLGRATVPSVNLKKTMTVCRGDMLLSDDGVLIGCAKRSSAQACERAESADNHCISHVQSARTRGQLTRMDESIARSRKRKEHSHDGLADIPFVRLLQKGPTGDTEDNCGLTYATLHRHTRHGLRNVLTHLQEAGIETRHRWKLTHLEPVFGYHRGWSADTSECLFPTGVTSSSGSAPIGPT